MSPNYNDTLEDSFPLLKQKRLLDEEIEEMTKKERADSREDDSRSRARTVEYIKAERPKNKKRFMTMSDLPQEDIFGNSVETPDVEQAEVLKPFGGVGRRLIDSRPFMYTAFYDGHELTIAVVGCALAVMLMGMRQLVALAAIDKYIHRIGEVIERQNREQVQNKSERRQMLQQYVMPRFA